jgi:hypothetical protein
MSAADDVWAAAGEMGAAPVTLDALPPAAVERLREWLRTPLQRGCAHPAPLATVLGARVARCVPCAAAAGLEALAAHCGGCGTEIHENGVRGVFAVAPELLAVVALCGDCTDRKESPVTDQPRERLTRLKAARARLALERARHDAERARRADLVPAHCRVCGGPVAQGEGERLPEPPSDRHGDSWSVVHESWMPAPRGADRWRRAHDRCARMTRADAIAAVAGVRLSEEQAQRVDVALPIAAAGPWNTTSERPWGFVTDAERAALRHAALLARAVGRAIQCADGACGVCGVRYAASWFESDLRWRDGSPAPVCGDCDPIWTRWGGTSAHASREERQRAAALEALTGYRLPLGHAAPQGLEPYARSSDGDPVGHEHPWAWSPRLEELRSEVWRVRPQLAPDDRRDEFEAQRSADVAAKAQARREAAEAEAAAQPVAW